MGKECVRGGGGREAEEGRGPEWRCVGLLTVEEWEPERTGEDHNPFHTE